MSHAVSVDVGDDPGSYAKKQRTVLISLIIDFILWIPDIIVAILSGSIVLFADAVKCGNEIIATFLAYLTIRKMAKGGGGIYDYGMGKMETITSVITGGVMLVSLMIVFVVALYRIAVPGEFVQARGIAGYRSHGDRCEHELISLAEELPVQPKRAITYHGLTVEVVPHKGVL